MPLPITKELVEKIVGESIKKFEVSEGCNEGDNMAGSLKCIKVTTENDKMISLVHKTLPGDLIAAAHATESGTFRIENTFYSVIAPKIEKLLESKNVSRTTLPIPKYYAGMNDDKNDYVTMEDLRPQSYIMPDKYKGLNYPETSLILKELARFHAITNFLLRYHGENYLSEFPLIVKTRWLDPEVQKGGVTLMNTINSFSIETMKTRNEEIALKMETFFSKNSPNELSFRTMFATDTKYFPCLIHGDIWGNNILIRYENDEREDRSRPVDVKFIDFQGFRRGNIFEDLQYFILTSTTPAFRRQHLRQVLDDYFDSFKNTMKELGSPMPIGFTRGFLVDNFENCLVPAYTFMIFAVPLQLGTVPKPDGSGPPQGPPPQVPQNGEGGEGPPAFNPLDIPLEVRMAGFAEHIKGIIRNSPKAVDRLEDITKEMVERGFL